MGFQPQIEHLWAQHPFQVCAVGKGFNDISIRRWAHPAQAPDRAITPIFFALAGKKGFPLYPLRGRLRNLTTDYTEEHGVFVTKPLFFILWAVL
jgi:hypothetical protein